jgi:hypothetical protein
MARALGVSQATVSLVVSGKRPAGKRLLAALANHPRVNAAWLATGDGEPLPPPLTGTLPVCQGVLPGPPADHGGLCTGLRHPVAETLDRPSRYWLAVSPGSPLVRDSRLRILAGDLLLMETDTHWTHRSDVVVGRLCGARLPGHAPEPAYGLGVVRRDPGGLALDLFDRVVRMAEPFPPAAPATAPAPPSSSRVGRSFGRPRRQVRSLEEEERRAPARAAAMAGPPGGDPGTALTPQDVVAVGVYLVRPELVLSDMPAPADGTES